MIHMTCYGSGWHCVWVRSGICLMQPDGVASETVHMRNFINYFRIQIPRLVKCSIVLA